MNDSLLNASQKITTVATQAIDKINFSTIDPNWFYSAAAQSSAAIVGLMGAFLTTRIINERNHIKQLEREIKNLNEKIKFLEESINPKIEWIENVDEEESLENIKDFLKEQLKEIDTENPPTVDELLEVAQQDERFENISKELLEKHYTQEYLEEAREKQTKHPFLGGLEMPNLLHFNPDIARDKNNRYRRYNEEINDKKSEISYCSNLIRTKRDEINDIKGSFDLKNILLNLGLFSIVGVFLPLLLMILDYDLMYKIRYFTFGLILLAWLWILGYLFFQIKKSTK